jgi:hypothetical protein
MTTFDFMKQFSMFAALATASGGSAPSRWAIFHALMSNEEIIEPREYPLPGSTPWYNKRAREESERAIDRICMAFQRLEELVSDQIGRLISDDGQLGTIITAELSFRNRLGLLCSLYLYRLRLTERPEALKTLLAKLQRAEERRNTILHSYWIKSPVCGMLTRYKYTAKSSKGLVHHTEDLEPEHIEAIATEIWSVADEFISHFETTFPSANDRTPTA